MNVFESIAGITLNGQWYTIDAIRSNSIERSNPALLPVFDFLKILIDDSTEMSVQTSGSTGSPKSWTFPKSAFRQSAEGTNVYFGLNPSSRALLALPMNFIAGQMMVVRALIGEYALHVVSPSSSPIPGGMAFDFAPLTSHQFLSSLRENPSNLGQLKQILLGGGEPIITDEQLRSIPKTKVYASFGMTETLSHMALSEIVPGRSSIVYKPLTGVEIRRSGNGALEINWPGITAGWLETRDLIETRSEGFIWLGRADFLINSGGLKILPEQLEKELATRIEEAFFFFGLPDPVLGEKLVLFVESDSPVYFDETWIGNKLHRPKQLIRLPEFIRGRTGKILRKATVDAWREAEN